MDKNYNLTNEQMKVLFSIGLGIYPEGPAVILSNGKNDYLVRTKDKRVLTIDNEPVLENLVISHYETPDGEINEVDRIADIPYKSEVVFKAVLKKLPTGIVKTRIKRLGPLVTKVLFDEEHAVKYLVDKD